MRQRFFTLSCILFVAVGFTGCSGGLDDAPETAEVTGTVTMDGKPLPNVNVTFQAEKNRPSFGVTDAEGKYTLSFSRDTKGAAIGENIVSIATIEDEGEYSEKEDKSDSKIPARYNSQSRTNPEMKVEVKAGDNVLNFDLKSTEE